MKASQKIPELIRIVTNKRAQLGRVKRRAASTYIVETSEVGIEFCNWMMQQLNKLK